MQRRWLLVVIELNLELCHSQGVDEQVAPHHIGRVLAMYRPLIAEMPDSALESRKREAAETGNIRQADKRRGVIITYL